jgi:transketolase
MTKKQLLDLRVYAAQIRLDVLNMLTHIGYGHLGGSFSIVELVAVLYGKQLNYDAKNPKWEDRDYVVLSKGHAGPTLYAALGNKGFFPKEDFLTLNAGGTNFPSHPDRLKTIGIDVTTGSLGQGTSQAAGIATGLKKLNKDSYVYLIVGDGELNEGQCWEAFEYIANYKLDNLIVIIDNNKRQLDGYTKDIMNPFNISDKMKAFGFITKNVKGDDIVAIDNAITELKEEKNSALCIVLDTVKGQGVKYYEDLEANHSVKFNNDEINTATANAKTELERFIKEGGSNV